MRKMKPHRAHNTKYPTINAAKIFGISLMFGFLPISSISTDVNADPRTREVRVSGGMIPPHFERQEVISWTSNMYLNDGSYLGITLNITGFPGADMSFLQSNSTLVNSTIQTAFQNEGCFGMDFALIGINLRQQLNLLAPNGTDPIAGMSIIKNFCEPDMPIVGDIVEPEHH